MRITTIEIRIVPSEGENTNAVTLRRNEDRQWSVVPDDGQPRGLFPREVRLAGLIQDHVLGGQWE